MMAMKITSTPQNAAITIRATSPGEIASTVNATSSQSFRDPDPEPRHHTHRPTANPFVPDGEGNVRGVLRLTARAAGSELRYRRCSMRRSRRSLIALALGAVLVLPACPSADAGDADVEITDTGTPTDGTDPTGTDSPEDETDTSDSDGGYDY
jgi:hypothetical protein